MLSTFICLARPRLATATCSLRNNWLIAANWATRLLSIAGGSLIWEAIKITARVWVITVIIITWIITTAKSLWKTTLGLKMYKPKVLFMEKCCRIILQALSCWNKRYRKLIRGLGRPRKVRLYWCLLALLRIKSQCPRFKIDSALTTKAVEHASPAVATRKTKKTLHLTRTTTRRVPTSWSFQRLLSTQTAVRPLYLLQTMSFFTHIHSMATFSHHRDRAKIQQSLWRVTARSDQAPRV